VSWWASELEALLKSNGNEALREALADLLFRVESRDALIGCWNRVYVEQRLEAELGEWHRAGIPVAFLFVDLDGMRKINARSGHRAGDAMLQEVGRHWRPELPANHRIIRTGGDEFLLVVPGISEAEAVRLSEKLHAHFPSPLTFSAGLLHKKKALPPLTAAALCIAGDQALFQAKAAGGNQTVTAPWPRPEAVD